MKDITKFINESLRKLDDILDEVENWFWDYCGEDGYDSPRQRREDFEAMANGSNDIMIDNCIQTIDLSDQEQEKYWDDIESKLAELCERELEDM
jgi:hypothetical protein